MPLSPPGTPKCITILPGLMPWCMPFGATKPSEAGAAVGMTDLPGHQWRPYSPATFLCPPFPSDVSGHSTISGGCAEALKLWTGNDAFGAEVKWVPGSLTEPDRLGDTVVLRSPIFTQTGEMAGQSRVLKGYHIQVDNVEGLALGRAVAREAWRFDLRHLGEEVRDLPAAAPRGKMAKTNK